MYYAKDYLPEAFVIEADIIVKAPGIFDVPLTKSRYFVSWKKKPTEWVLDVEKDRIKNCEIQAEREGYQLWGISMWTREDGEKLSALIEQEYKNGNWTIYWDELALFKYKDRFNLGIREINEDFLKEIDTFEELVQVDDSYRNS